MRVAEAVFVLLFMIVPVVVVGALFVWAAIKDGEDDDAHGGLARRWRGGLRR